MISEATINEFYQLLRRRQPDVNLSHDQAEEILYGIVHYGDTLAKIAKANDLNAQKINGQNIPD